MKRILHSLACLLCGLMLPLAGAAEAAQTPEAALGESLSPIFERYQTVGACVAAIENGRVRYVYCYGSRDPGGEPVTERTLFRVGSISKMVTAMGVMRLVEDGALALDGDLGDALGFTLRHPDYPHTLVTLRQLMSHTAGLRDSGYYTMALRGAGKTLSGIFTGDSANWLFYSGSEPGMKCEYSNFGGGMLGSLIEAASGQTVDEYMNEQIFAPLGVTAAYQSGLLPQDAEAANMYSGRSLAARVMDGAPAYTAPDADRHFTLTAGKLTISAPDLAKLVIALCDGGVCGDARVLRESSALAMTTNQSYVGSVACETTYGLCTIFVKDAFLPGRTLVGHGGKANGMLCAAYFDPADRTGVVMLTNGCKNNSYVDGVAALTRAVIRAVYDGLFAEGAHQVEDPFLVE